MAECVILRAKGLILHGACGVVYYIIERFLHEESVVATFPDVGR